MHEAWREVSWAERGIDAGRGGDSGETYGGQANLVFNPKQEG